MDRRNNTWKDRIKKLPHSFLFWDSLLHKNEKVNKIGRKSKDNNKRKKLHKLCKKTQ